METVIFSPTYTYLYTNIMYSLYLEFISHCTLVHSSYIHELGYIGMQPDMAAFSKIATYFSKSFNLVK